MFNPANKKEWQDYTIRNISRDLLDTPAKLKEVIVSQCGENIVPEEVGYFNQATKHWIHNRLDMNDVWDMIESGAKITLWCTDCATVNKPLGGKRTNDTENESGRKKQKLSSMDEKKALAEEHEHELREKHGDKYTHFQYKLWAEMLASGVHTDSDEPPAASMFPRTTKRPKGTQLESSNSNDAVVSGMMNMMNTFCHAVTTKQVGSDKLRTSGSASPMKKAELRTTYMKQLSDLRKLYDDDILSTDEYEEQRLDIVTLMRELK